MMQTRAATPADIPLLVEFWYERALLQQLPLAADGRARWTVAASQWLNDANTGFFVVTDEADRVSGYIVGHRQPAPPGLAVEWQGMVAEIALDAHHYQRGAGRTLFAALRAWFHEQGIQRIMVQVSQRSALEQAFWRGLGAVKWMEILWIR